jgi:hypothetical protein
MNALSLVAVSLLFALAAGCSVETSPAAPPNGTEEGTASAEEALTPPPPPVNRCALQNNYCIDRFRMYDCTKRVVINCEAVNNGWCQQYAASGTARPGAYCEFLK